MSLAVSEQILLPFIGVDECEVVVAASTVFHQYCTVVGSSERKLATHAKHLDDAPALAFVTCSRKLQCDLRVR